MKKLAINNLDLTLYQETLDNGLQIYICPMERQTAHASLATKFGNDIIDFNVNKEDKNIPTGTAHFFEHKLFAQKDGTDPISKFDQNGALANAYTTSKVTRYYFNCTSNFKENLSILLDFVTHPYFTEENIAKEQGIIAQEIKAGFDDPDEMSYYLTLEGLFKNHPHKYPVAGYINTISKLTKENLYDIYNTFYHPSNMFIVITGKVNPEETIKQIKQYYKTLNYGEKPKIQIKKYDEKEEVAHKRQILKREVVNKKLVRGYKIKIPKQLEIYKLDLYLSIYLDTLFGNSTNFFGETFKDKNIINKVSYYTDIVDNYIIIFFYCEVKESEEVLEKIDQIIKEKNYNQELFELIKKSLINKLIKISDNVNMIANIITTYHIYFNKFDNDIYNKYRSLNYQEFKEYINKINFNNSTISIIKKD